MPLLVINGTPINFPNSAASPDWSPAVISFAESVTSALNNIVGTYDVVAQQFNLTPVPFSVVTPITNLAFSTAEVISAIIEYAVYRNTNTTTLSEAGTLTVVYNVTNMTGEKWQMLRETDSDASVIFTIDDSGQVYINTTTISGTSYNGFISYRARTLQNVYP